MQLARVGFPTCLIWHSSAAQVEDQACPAFWSSMVQLDTRTPDPYNDCPGRGRAYFVDQSSQPLSVYLIWGLSRGAVSTDVVDNMDTLLRFCNSARHLPIMEDIRCDDHMAGSFHPLY